MNKKNIVVIVKPDGSISIDAVGFKGAECEKATKFLHDSLGQVQSSKKKPEYIQTAQRQSAFQ